MIITKKEVVAGINVAQDFEEQNTEAFLEAMNPATSLVCDAASLAAFYEIFTQWGKTPICTDQTATPVQILKWFVHSWKVEVTFQEVRSHLGVDIVPFRVNSAPMVRKGYRSHYTDFARIIFLDHFASAPISS